MLSPKQLSHLQKQLLHTKQDLQHRLEENDHLGQEQAMSQESLGELSNYDNHPADHGTELFERGKDVALLEHAEEELQDVQTALEAIERGNYGYCEICNEPISYERLQALPTAARCINHSKNQTVSKHRPVEEEVLLPPFGQFVYDDRDNTMYDAEDTWQDVARYGTSETPSDFEDPKKANYDEMFIEADEPIGFTEEIESFLMSDMEGNFIGIAPNQEHEHYEEELDEEGIMAITGGFGGVIWDFDEDI